MMPTMESLEPKSSASMLAEGCRFNFVCGIVSETTCRALHWSFCIPGLLLFFCVAFKSTFADEPPAMQRPPVNDVVPPDVGLSFYGDAPAGHAVFTSTPSATPPEPLPGVLSDPEDTISFPYSTAFRQHTGTASGSPFAPAVGYDPHVPEEEEPFASHIIEGFLDVIGKPAQPSAKCFARLLQAEHDEPQTALDEHAIGLQPGPARPDLLIETNEKFLGIGFLNQGVRLKTGAVWRPSLWVFGTYRTGINYFDSGNGSHVAEWANRLDLFSQLNLSGTERVLFGIRPFDEEEATTRDFGGFDFDRGRWRDAWNGDVQTLFFEGDFGEIFPTLDPYDQRALDFGFSIGRQPLSFQQGLLINEDRIDAVTITRNTLSGNGNLNLRATCVYAWNEINRNNLAGGNVDVGDSKLVGLFTESDFRKCTVNADVACVWSDNGIDDLVAVGLSSIQRLSGYHNTYNSSLHFLASFPTHMETNLAGQGELLFSQFSWTPHHTHDLVFLNAFWAIDQFTSASRGPLAGGPLGQTGLLFSAAGLGRYGAPLNNQASNVAGASLGYQMFFDHTKQQVVFEIGGRQDTDETGRAAVAGGIRYQKALDQHWLVVVDGFVLKREGNDVGQGGRVELQMKF